MMDTEKSWFWLSFADDGGFLGGCLIEAPDFISALAWSHLLGINPGGECKGLGPIPDSARAKDFPVNCLLRKDEIPNPEKWEETNGHQAD